MMSAVWDVTMLLLMLAVWNFRGGGAQAEVTITVDGGNVVPIGHSTTFTCRRTIKAAIFWQFNIGSNGCQGGVRVHPSDQYNSSGINFIPSEDSFDDTSTLRINGSFIETNNTCIRCLLRITDFSFPYETAVYFRIYDAPSTPEDLVASPGDLNTLLITWSPSFADLSFPVTYQMEVSSYEDQDVLSTNLTNITSFLFSPQQPSCSPFLFNVTAFNEVGRSNSVAITVSSFSLNTSDIISQTVEHQLDFTKGSLVVSISFLPPVFCMDWFTDDELAYYLILTEQDEELQLGPYFMEDMETESRVSLLVNSTSIQENSVFSYALQVSGNISISSSLPLYTTDVQEALLRIDYTQQAFELVCSFFNGSRARGCYLVLNGTFGSYSKQVARENRSARHNHFVEGYLGELSYSVFDWEEDGTVGDIAIPVHEVVLPSKKPPEPTSKPTKSPLLIPLSAVGVVVVVLVLVISIVIVVLCILHQNKGSLNISAKRNGAERSGGRNTVASKSLQTSTGQEGIVYEDVPMGNMAKANGRNGPVSPAPSSPPPSPPPPPSSPPPSSPPPPSTPPPPPSSSSLSSSPPSYSSLVHSLPSPSSPAPLLPQEFPPGKDNLYAELQLQKHYSKVNEVPYYHVLEKPRALSPYHTPSVTPSESRLTFCAPSTSPPPPPPPQREYSPQHIYSEVKKNTALQKSLSLM